MSTTCRSTDCVSDGASSYAFSVHNNGVMNDVRLVRCSFSNGATGCRIRGSVDGFVAENCHFDDNSYGLYANLGSGDGTYFQNVTVRACTFDGNASKGIYLEKLSDALFDGISVRNSGTSGSFSAGVDINLKYAAYHDITFVNVVCIGSGQTPVMAPAITTGSGITVKGRNDAPSYDTVPASLTGLRILGGIVSDADSGISIGNDVDDIEIEGVSFSDFDGNWDVGGLSATGVGPFGLLNYTDASTVVCRNCWWGDASGPGDIPALFPDALDAPGTGVPLVAGVGLADYSPWLTHDPSDPCADFTATSYATGTEPVAVALGDLDSDSAADLVVANLSSDDLTVRLNDGAGDFSSVSTVALTAGDAPSSVTTGDLVPGGGVDVAVACSGSDVVRLLSGDGAGNLTVSGSLTVSGHAPSCVLAADLDGTGADDLVVGLGGSPLVGGEGVDVFLDSASPAAALTAPAGGFGRVVDLAAADLDSDGDLDLVVVCQPSLSSSTSGVFVYENGGAGSFSLVPGSLTTPSVSAAVCVQDVDGNGGFDLIVADTGDAFLGIEGSVHVFYHDGGAMAPLSLSSWSTSYAFPVAHGPTAIACGDLEDDFVPGFVRRPDVVTTNLYASGGSVTFLRAFDGAYTPSIGTCPTPASGVSPVAVELAELDGHPAEDVVLVDRISNDVTVLLGICRPLTTFFGSGCGGADIPQATADSTPSLGNPAFGVRVQNGPVGAPGVLGVSPTLAPVSLGLGCTLYLGAPIVTLPTFTNAQGARTLAVPIPNDPALDCASIFWQWVIFDPSAPGSFAFSDAIRTRLGA